MLTGGDLIVRRADDMIDAHLDDGTDLDCGSDVESEFGGAAAYDHDTSASPEPGCGGGPASDAAALPLNGAASLDNSNWQPMGAFGSDVRSGTVPEAGAATGASGSIAARLSQRWKLAEHGLGQAGRCEDSIAMVPVRQRSHSSNQLPVRLASLGVTSMPSMSNSVGVPFRACLCEEEASQLMRALSAQMLYHAASQVATACMQIHLIRITTVLVAALAVAWGFMLVSPSSEPSLTVQPA